MEETKIGTTLGKKQTSRPALEVGKVK